MTTATIAPPSCGSCTLCCKLMAVKELDKPYGQWCGHCEKAGGGCKVYDTRPPSCREFECMWLQSQVRLGRAWPIELRPDRSKVVLATTTDDKGIVAHVDPAYPNAWREGPIARILIAMIERADLPVIVACGEKRHGYIPKRLGTSYREIGLRGTEHYSTEKPA